MLNKQKFEREQRNKKKIEAFKNEPNQSLAIQKTYKRIVVILANECKYNIYLYNINLFIYKYL